jgi:hypothetical protein
MTGTVPWEDRPLTPRERDAMDFIVAFERKHGRMPSMKTVGAGLGIGNSQHLVDHLRHKGWLSRESKGGPLRIERRRRS